MKICSIVFQWLMQQMEEVCIFMTTVLEEWQ